MSRAGHGWTDEQLALQESTREFVRREVTPHLQEWEDACEVPRSLHLAAAKAGLLGVSFPEEVGGQGGTLLDSVAMQEAFFEAGGSSGLAAALFTGGIALPHMAAHGTPEQIDAFVRPTLAGEKIGVARGHRARRRVRRRGDPHDRRTRRRHLRRQRRQDLHHQRRPRRLRHHRGPHRRARATPGSACSSSRRARPASPSTGR